ncbi:hypothetical protein NPIL_94301 [Nephila pilipes]|uniref:DUF5641 domain-containing protein n=1 Tax=Nephila pilipes TaxID=299642 RepID=A0A8X6QSN8_NEPPI|nr:hypothetical protein NPIL_94301 [Nephila pilipes]
MKKKDKTIFTEKFRFEYVGNLRQSSKGVRYKKQIQVGDVVFVHNIKIKKNEWLFPQVIELFLSSDEHVLFTKVKIKKSEKFLCPVDILIPLDLTIEPVVPDRRTGVRRVVNHSSSDVT